MLANKFARAWGSWGHLLPSGGGADIPLGKNVFNSYVKHAEGESIDINSSSAVALPQWPGGTAPNIPTEMDMTTLESQAIKCASFCCAYPTNFDQFKLNLGPGASVDFYVKNLIAVLAEHDVHRNFGRWKYYDLGEVTLHDAAQQNAENDLKHYYFTLPGWSVSAGSLSVYLGAFENGGLRTLGALDISVRIRS